MWQARRRLQRLEQEVAEARAAQAVLQERIEMFEKIAAAAGAALDGTELDDSSPQVVTRPPGAAAAGAAAAASAARPLPGGAGGGVPALRPPPPVPPTLLAAAADPGRKGAPVRLAVDGSEVIAVIGEEGGDPRAWWAAIRRVAGWIASAS